MLRFSTISSAVCLLLFGAFAVAVSVFANDDERHADWAKLKQYADDNTKLAPPSTGEKRVVFFGDSITQGWQIEQSFPGKPYINRGISGQTTPQMLVRFRQDVLNLSPKAVVILAGTNDLACNTGEETNEQIEGYITSMCELARTRNIKIVLSSILPVVAYPWRKDLEPAPRVVALNNWMKSYAEKNGFVYLDYFSAMKDNQNGLPKNLSEDGVHPTAAGYAVMKPLAEKAIAEALK